jgi:hypothetical protein
VRIDDIKPTPLKGTHTMGAWGFGPFENDDASDWIYELEESTDLSVITPALRTVTGIGGDYLEASDASNALAAAEVVAALLRHPAAELPVEVQAWVDKHLGVDVSSLVPAAKAAIQRIRTDSELKELWDESEDAAKWYATLDDLSSRLNEE